MEPAKKRANGESWVGKSLAIEAFCVTATLADDLEDDCLRLAEDLFFYR